MFKKAMSVAAALGVGFIAAAQTENTLIYELPGESTYPEGIAYDEHNRVFYVGSASKGTIYQGDLQSGEVTTLIPGGERGAFATLGLKVDDEARLWVAGGTSGQVFIYDLETAEQTHAISTPGEGDPLLNDLVVTSSGDVYVTDSFRPILFKIAAGSESAEAWLDFTGTAFAYQAEGPNANGIEVTPDDRYLLIVQMNTGQLFRVEVASKEVSEVDLGGETLAGGDGLMLDGQMLYTIIQTGDEIVSVALNDDFSSGNVVSRTRDTSLAYPATAALVDDRLLVVNAQFDAMESEEGPTLPFTVSSIPLAVLQ